jgi:hypothetical protein
LRKKNRMDLIKKMNSYANDYQIKFLKIET